MRGRSIDRPSELRSALQEALEEPGPYLLNVKVSPEENVYPMIPSGGAVNEMILDEPQPVETAGRRSAEWGQPRLTDYLRWKWMAGRLRRTGPTAAHKPTEEVVH